jgi:hypothetical protein
MEAGVAYFELFPAFAWRNEKRNLNRESRGSRPRFEPGTCRIQLYSFTSVPPYSAERSTTGSASSNFAAGTSTQKCIKLERKGEVTSVRQLFN